jgi:threonine dehydrogenase-like Zn-dependent dehydrogenase
MHRLETCDSSSLSLIVKINWVSTVRNYNEQLLHPIKSGRTDPSPLVSHSMKLQNAQNALKGYKTFDKKNDLTEVVFKTPLIIN